MNDSPVRVYASSNAFDGLLTKGHLEAEGIKVLMKGEGEGQYRAGPVYLWVLPEDEDDAREIIRAIESGAYATSEDDVLGADEDVHPTGGVSDERPLR
ncbi:MAG: putative signal transducing protein [Actinomycetota bacterium]